MEFIIKLTYYLPLLCGFIYLLKFFSKYFYTIRAFIVIHVDDQHFQWLKLTQIQQSCKRTSPYHKILWPIHFKICFNLKNLKCLVLMSLLKLYIFCLGTVDFRIKKNPPMTKKQELRHLKFEMNTKDVS